MTIQDGDRWAVVGPNGAGKSTLLRLMAGLYRPTGGTVTLEGVPGVVLSRRNWARRVAFLPQQPRSVEDLRVEELVLMGRFPHRRFGMFDSAEDFRFAQEAMRLTGVAELASRPMATLSGGEAQRALLAAALAQSPRVLLLDEPIASLDLGHQLEILALLRHLAQAEGLSLVMVLHDVNLAARFCTKILLLHEGRVAAQGEPRAVLTAPSLAAVYDVNLVALRAGPDDADVWLVPDVHAAPPGKMA